MTHQNYLYKFISIGHLLFDDVKYSQKKTKL